MYWVLLHISHQDIPHWNTPKNHDDTHCRKDMEVFFYCVCIFICIYMYRLPSHQVLQSWEIVDPGGKCRPMCTQEHSDTSTQRLPSKTLPTEKHIHTMLLLLQTQGQREELDMVGEWLPGHVQPSSHSSLQTSWMLRLWQVVEQDLVHSLYCIPIGHFSTANAEKQKYFVSLVWPSIA